MIARLIALSLTALTLTAGRAVAAEALAPPSFAAIRTQALEWAARRGSRDEQSLARIAEIWKAPPEGDDSRALLDRLVRTFAAADPDVARLLEKVRPGQSATSLPTNEVLSRDESDVFFTANLRLYLGRSLTQRQLYDEALAVFGQVDPAQVVDPASCLFHQSVCYHQLARKEEGLKAISRLLKETRDAPEPYMQVAALMQNDLASLEEKTLDEVHRKMRDSERRLDLGRSGQRVQKVQDEIVEVLDEIIKKVEAQASSSAASAGSSQNQSNRSDGPADDSGIKGATAPGDVDKRNLKKQGSWGNLSTDVDATKAQGIINREFPSNYRQAVEEYLKKLAKRPGQKGQ